MNVTFGVTLYCNDINVFKLRYEDKVINYFIVVVVLVTANAFSCYKSFYYTQGIMN